MLTFFVRRKELLSGRTFDADLGKADKEGLNCRGAVHMPGDAQFYYV